MSSTTTTSTEPPSGSTSTSTTAETSPSSTLPPTGPSQPPVTTQTPPPPTSLSPTLTTSNAITLITLTPPTTTTLSTTTSPPTTTSSTTPTLPTPVGVTTTTSIIVISSSRNVAPTGAATASNSGRGFFKNTGAVAGVFTVVGLIALAILIAFVTNSIRRRRARKFDDEIAAAARDAANTQVPNFYDDDDDYRTGYGPSGGKFSDASHGTFAQPPMNPAPRQEMYGMREIAHGPAPGEYFDSGAYPSGGTSAGAAGIGVARARSMRDGGYAAGLQEGTSPYPAFAAPVAGAAGAPGAGSHYPPGMIRGAGGPEFDLARRPSQYTQQTDYTAPSRNKSVTSAEGNGSTAYHSSSTGSPAPSYPKQDLFYNPYPQQGGYPNSYGAYANSSAPNPPALAPSPPEEDLNAAYDGYVVDEPAPAANTKSTAPASGSLPNPFDANPGPPKQAEYADESDYEQEMPKRVLKVANE